MKRHDQHWHAKYRARTRYGENINDAGFAEIIRSIKAGGALMLKTWGNGRDEWMVRSPRGTLMRCVYDANDDRVCTFLPLEEDAGRARMRRTRASKRVHAPQFGQVAPELVEDIDLEAVNDPKPENPLMAERLAAALGSKR